MPVIPVNIAGRPLSFNSDPQGLEAHLRQALNKDSLVLVYANLGAFPDREKLSAAGIVVQDNVQGSIYSLLFRRPATAASMATAGIVSWAPVLPVDKLSSWFTNQQLTEQPGVILLSVVKGLNFNDVQKVVADAGGKLLPSQPWKAVNIWRIEPGAEIPLQDWTKPGFVRFVQPEFEPQTCNWQAIGFTNSQRAHQPVALGGYDLHGEGVTIGVGDNSDPDHIDYVDRVISFNPILSTDHGFHTTGTVGGNGIRDEKMKGYANKSTLISDYYSQVISNGATYHVDLKMMLSSNSYASVLSNCGYAGTYDLYSQFLDQQARDYPRLLNVFAAGNDGRNTCSPFEKGLATVAGSYQSSKNVLTVGAIGKTMALEADYTSQGPVKDGRLKPEIVAVGTDLYSTVLDNGYLPSSGTSMATPNVGGAAGLLYQRYRQRHNGDDASSGLVKILLMNGATDLGRPGPDFKNGFGLMNLGHSLTMLDSGRYFSATVNTGQERAHTITVPPNTAQLKVMLYWHDPAAAAFSSSVLINDLDLTVTTPSAAKVYPLILDPNPARATAPAVQGVDRRNNVEQVVIESPTAGTYTVRVNGYQVPELGQEYFVAYDLVPEGISLQYPVGGEALNSADSMMIYWEASGGNNSFALSYSTDNGANWRIIRNDIAADQRSYTWFVPDSIVSNRCLVRLIRNNTGQQSQSNAFTLVRRPEAVLSLAAEQCPGSLKMTWAPVAGVSTYQVFKKQGPEMVLENTVNGTTYTFRNLSPDTTYWVAVAPVVNGSRGMRSIAISRQPDNGDCSGVSPGDLSLSQLVSPQDGRRFTSSALTNRHPLTVVVRNFDGRTASQYRVAYRLNNGAWADKVFNDNISPGGSRQLLLDYLNLSAAGNYDITIVVTNLAYPDPVSGNDTLSVTVRQLDNEPMNLSGGYLEGFENTGNLDITGKSRLGLEGAGKWDFVPSKAKGRIRSFVTSDITIEGSRSISLDNAHNQVYDIAGSSYNTLTGTFNLGAYNMVNWELRCDFTYLVHGLPKFDTGNYAWVRGSDTDPWLPLSAYKLDTNNMGQIYHSGSLSLTDVLNAAGQSFSASTHVRFTQYDTSRIGSPSFGNGFTMDDFNLYLVTDDVQLLAVDSLYHYNCGLSDRVPLRVRVANGVQNTVYNVAVYCQLNDLPVIAGFIDSIQGKDTVVYTFDQPLDLSQHGAYTLSTWLYLPTDTYRLNDSLLQFSVRNQPVIADFPYLQNFEKDDGFFYAEGNNNSWAYGSPASSNVDHAASGTRAWKTNLEGTYNNREVSFLYSPCFDISGMQRPTLSFNVIVDIEEPEEQIFDVAYVEYSNDGYTWKRLGQSGSGTNWYNNDSAQAWTQRGKTYWHVATTALPADGPVISLRFVLRTDQGAEFEGLAIDDIHIYDLQQPIFTKERFPEAVRREIDAGQGAGFENSEGIAMAIPEAPSALGWVSGQSYGHTGYINEDSTQYFLPRNFTLQAETPPGDSVSLRFYLPDTALQIIRADAICYSCSKPMEVQQLGITQYADPDKAKENNLLSDNIAGRYSFIPAGNITWVPYDIGYYGTVKVRSFSEFWFNDGGPGKDQVLPTRLFDFDAAHYGTRYARLDWTTRLNEGIAFYELQRADDNMAFLTIATFNATNGESPVYTYVDTPALNGPRVFYRVQYTLKEGGTFLSRIRSLDWSDKDAQLAIYPNPVRNGILNMEWFKGSGDGLQWSLNSITGREIMNGYFNEDNYNGKRIFHIGTLGLAPGIYMLKVVSAKDKWAFKVVVQ